MSTALPIIEPPSAAQPPGCSTAAGLPITGHLAGLSCAPVPLAERRPLPMSAQEMRERGWDAVDVVFVTGDAYVDHPSFAMAILGRVLEAAGFRVGIAQPARLAVVRRRGGSSAGRGCSSPSARATWTR